MKTTQIILLMIFAALAGAAISLVIVYYTVTKVDLPEEYHLINKQDNLKGYFTNDGVLHIEFNNKQVVENNNIQFIWNDDEESIPQDNSLITLEFTDENKVYIGPYDSKAKIN